MTRAMSSGFALRKVRFGHGLTVGLGIVDAGEMEFTANAAPLVRSQRIQSRHRRPILKRVSSCGQR